MSVFFSIENILISSKLLNWEMSLDKDRSSDQKERGENKRGKKLRNYWLICYSLMDFNLS